MSKPYGRLRDKIRSDERRVARVAAYRQAMEDALALGEIREKRELTQSDIARLLETSQANPPRTPTHLASHPHARDNSLPTWGMRTPLRDQPESA